jgi:hypothetical protein
VQVKVRGLFGDEVLEGERWNAVAVEVTNRTERTFRGRVVVPLQESFGNSNRVHHRVPLDLPPKATRRVQFTVFVGSSTLLEARYEAEGRTLGTGRTSYGRVSGARVVVLADPPRIRRTLSDLTATSAGSAGGFVAHEEKRKGSGTPIATGVAKLHPDTGDPRLPAHPAGWSAVDLLVASAPLLSRVGSEQRAALIDWLNAGGRMLVFPRTEVDLRAPLLRSVAGSLSRCDSSTESDRSSSSPFVPPEAPSCLRGGEGTVREAFGISAPAGFGRVYVAAYDGTRPPHVQTDAVRRLVRRILESASRGAPSPALSFAKGQDSASGGMFGGGGRFSKLRRALDPNEEFRSAFALVALLLLAYVVLVGPVNFAFVRKRRRPMLALVTTPAAAAACSVLMIGAGYFGKGVQTRYRAVELSERVEGAETGPSRRYLGLFPTRPVTFDLRRPERGVMRTLNAHHGERSAFFDHGAHPAVLRSVEGRLWETLFARQDRMRTFEGTVHFERNGERIARVRNHLGQRLRGAVLVDTSGRAFALGEIEPGASAGVPSSAEMSLPAPGTGGGHWSEEQARRLSALLDLPRERGSVLRGLASVGSGPVLSTDGSHAVLLARVSGQGASGAVAETFSEGFEVRLLRVIARGEPEPLRVRESTSASSSGAPPASMPPPPATSKGGP